MIRYILPSEIRSNDEIMSIELNHPLRPNNQAKRKVKCVTKPFMVKPGVTLATHLTNSNGPRGEVFQELNWQSER